MNAAVETREAAPIARRHASSFAFAACSATAVLHTAAFPPFDLAETAWVFAVSVLLWAVREPRWGRFLVAVFAASFASWLVLLEWLREVTWAGPFGLAAVMALFPTAWFAGARFGFPDLAGRHWAARLSMIAGLAGWWVVLEWVRSWFLTGFPWLPLAASQWQRPLLLQTAAIGGAWTVSFALVFANLCLAAALIRSPGRRDWRRRIFSADAYAGAVMAVFVVSFGLFARAGQKREPFLNAGVVQPNVPQMVKWDPAAAPEIFHQLEAQTREVARLNPDAIFWPEAITPVPIAGDAPTEAWVANLARAADRPIVGGAVAIRFDSRITLNSV